MSAGWGPDLEDGRLGGDHGEGGLDAAGLVLGAGGRDELALQVVGGGGGGLELALVLLGRPLGAGVAAHEGEDAHACGLWRVRRRRRGRRRLELGVVGCERPEP